VTCLPAAVSLLLLKALFMQISGVSLSLTWPCKLCLLRVLLCASLCYKLSPFQAQWGRWHCTHFLRPACLCTVHMGSGSSPLSCEVFLPPPLSQAFPLLVFGHKPLLLPETLQPTRLVYLQFREGSLSPIFSTQCAPTLFPVCLYCSYCLLLSFSFFPRGRSVCSGGYAALAQGCLWKYHGTTQLTLSMSSQAVWVWVSGSPGALLVSPFNLKWRFSVLAGGMEGSKLCLFSVVLTAWCVSSVSPRFHYKRHAFCFLPVAAILASSNTLLIFYFLSNWTLTQKFVTYAYIFNHLLSFPPVLPVFKVLHDDLWPFWIILFTGKK
jgi:hypothetical protein